MPTKYCLDLRSKELAKFALLSEKPISFKDVDYWPKRYFKDQGGYIHFIFTVCFNDTIPDEFTYKIELIDRNKVIAHTITDTLPTQGKNEVPVQALWDGKINGQTMPFGAAYGPHIVVTANISSKKSGLSIMEEASAETDPCGGDQGDDTDGCTPCDPNDCDCEGESCPVNPQS
jgi:hypothetical protein